MKVERIEPARRLTGPGLAEMLGGPPDEIAKLQRELKAARATIRALKRQVKAEQAHATAMVIAMEEMGREAWARMARRCVCTPARSDLLRR
jgi:hypothetical protein